MNFADLQIFKTVVEEGGIIKAARKLHRVPSNITTRIKHLESAVGIPLFHRNRQRLHLSPSGELLLGYAARLIDLSEEARHVVSGTAPQGLLKLGSLESTTASRLPAVLAEFHRRYPDVRLELTTGTNDALVNAVTERRLDAAFIAEPPSARTLAHMPVFRERLMVISSLDHEPIKSARDAEGQSLIAFPDGCAYRRSLQRWLRRDSLTTSRVLDLSSYHAIVACVAAGAGIALMPEAVLDAMPLTRVRRNPIPRSQSEIVTPLIWRKGEVSPPVLALRTLMASVGTAPKRRVKQNA
ncbi:MAG: LysR family transcriptional regulator [Candidatus Afipia apatlaquensis]|uniref:LysR family transcriptional regulator n=1 Tax=Candidatus Afipia apatlaquensis TaxID=2712852 RepID=A0A7C9RLG4_9BRAD|nr:LysR family transcriptional regulator [Candidatus Afipia apatlaquensis]